MAYNRKQRYILDRARHWCEYFRLGQFEQIRVDFSDKDCESDCDSESVISEGLRKEELTISRLERAIIGEKAFDRTRGLNTDGKALADIDTSMSEYGKYTITVYPALTDIPWNKFTALANATVLHEILHVVMCPMASYINTLEG
jgi:hypothetical protein